MSEQVRSRSLPVVVVLLLASLLAEVHAGEALARERSSDGLRSPAATEVVVPRMQAHMAQLLGELPREELDRVYYLTRVHEVSKEEAELLMGRAAAAVYSGGLRELLLLGDEQALSLSFTVPATDASSGRPALAERTEALGLATLRDLDAMVRERLSSRAYSDSDYLVMIPAIAERPPDNGVVPPMLRAEPTAGGVVVHEDFEGDPWSRWVRGDSTGGQYKFEKSSCGAIAGSYSGDAVRGGTLGSALSCTAPFPRSIETWMEDGQCEALAGASSAWLDFYYNYSTSWGGVAYVYYTDATGQLRGLGFGGTYEGWHHAYDLKNWRLIGDVTALACPKVRFCFKSDTSTPTGYGARIDEITIRTDSQPTFSCNASVTPLTGPAPLTITAAASATGASSSAKYFWMFADGVLTPGASTQTHTYSSPGEYFPNLTVEDGKQKCTAWFRVVVTAPGGAVPVTTIHPESGPTAGGTPVTINGSKFAVGASVTFGGTPATEVAVHGPTTITARAPAHASGNASVKVVNPDGGSGSVPSGFTYLGGPGSASATVVVPIVLSSAGINNSFFTSELTLTNRGGMAATVELVYTAAFGGGSGSATDTLAPGTHRIVPDAIDYLRTLGVPIPASGNRGGTLVVRFTGLGSPSDAAATVRTTTAVAEGRAGLAYAAVTSVAALTGKVWLCGLRQTATDRSNVAILNAGTSGDVVLRVTVHSGDPAASGTHVLPDETLPPGAFKQYSGVLDEGGYTNGFVEVERVGGGAPYYAYAVINDQANSDGSFVPPLPEASLAGRKGLSLPVAVETSAFSTELVVTNFSASQRSVRLSYVADAIQTSDKTASFSLTLAPREQRIVPGLVQYLRELGAPGIGAPGPTYAGAVFATADAPDVSGIFLGGRTSASGGGGRYGLFYTATPSGQSPTGTAWIYGLLQDNENRSNLALVNTGETDATSDTFRVDLFDGQTGALAGKIEELSLAPRQWTQIGTILSQAAPGTSSAYARVTRTSGNNPYLAYAVVNDGGQPGERSGDGAFVPAVIACTYGISPATRSTSYSGSTGTVSVQSPAGCPWSAASQDDWLTITAGASGAGDGTVSYSASDNPSSTARTGTLVIAGKTFSLTQSGKSSPGTYDGSWSGSTSQSRSFSFRVLNNQIVNVAMDLNARIYPCEVDGYFSLDLATPVNITGGSFSFSPTIRGSGLSAVVLTISGRFDSDRSASGTVAASTIITSSTLCVGSSSTISWSASRQ